MADLLRTETLDDLNGRFITFNIGSNVFSLELLNVIEIINVQSITPVPHVPNYVKGIMNLRGKILPVIDVRLKLKMEARPYDDKTCIIVAQLDEVLIGLIVDSISDVVNIDSHDLAEHPEHGQTKADKYLKSVTKVGNRVILNLDCEKFINSDYLLGTNR